jgi:hypothetical protein
MLLLKLDGCLPWMPDLFQFVLLSLAFGPT